MKGGGKFSIFGQASRGLGGSPGGSLGGVVLGIWAVFLSDGVSEYTCGWVAQRKLAMGEDLHLEAQPSLRGCIRPLSNGTTHCLSSKGVSPCRGPGTLVKGGYGLSRPGGNLGFRV